MKIFFPVVLLSVSGWAGVMGTWRTADREALVGIYSCDGGVCGKIVWMKDPLKEGKPRIDEKNPSLALRQRPVQGLVILHGFRDEGRGVWSGGRIYDPKSGNEYRARLTLKNENTIELRGYIGVPLLGRSERWTREEN